jgi:hypothetical protein
MLDPRQQRGLEIAATARIVKKGAARLVPSQSGNGRYKVRPETPHCNCPDHELRGVKCKRIIAVEYVIQRERHADGSATITETMTIRETVRKTYPQNWSAYNAAQTHEKEEFLELLRDLCAGIPEPPASRTGRPRLPMRDVVFACLYKIYSTVSARRFMSDLRDAANKGYLSRLPHFNSIFNYLENPELTPILRQLIVETSSPLTAVETDFAVDSSRFTSSRFIRWSDHKYAGPRQQHEWITPCLRKPLACGNERR